MTESGKCAVLFAAEVKHPIQVVLNDMDTGGKITLSFEGDCEHLFNHLSSVIDKAMDALMSDDSE